MISEQIAGITDIGVIVGTIGKMLASNLYKEIRAKMVGTTCNGVAFA